MVFIHFDNLKVLYHFFRRTHSASSIYGFFSIAVCFDCKDKFFIPHTQLFSLCPVTRHKGTKRGVDCSTPRFSTGPGSNRDGLPQRCLRPSRLPIPPSGLCVGKVTRFASYLQINRATASPILQFFQCRGTKEPTLRGEWARRVIGWVVLGF